MLFTQQELEQLRQKALAKSPVRSRHRKDEFFYDPDGTQNEAHVLWNDGESSELFHGGNEFWDMYPTVN